jgi:hypothetical protein
MNGGIGVTNNPATIERLTPVDREYVELEGVAIHTIREYLTSEGSDPSMLAKAKIAQGTLGSVQSHFKTAMARRVLDFTMARSLTSDPTKLAEYIRLTQPASGIIQALPAPGGK